MLVGSAKRAQVEGFVDLADGVVAGIVLVLTSQLVVGIDQRERRATPCCAGELAL